MRLVNKTIVTAMALSFAFILGCTKNDDSTVILLGPENNIKDIDEVTSVLVGDSIVKLTDFYRNNVDSIIPDGFLPPNIEGTYLVSPNIRVASTNTISDTFTPDTICFYTQNNGVASCRFREQQVDEMYVLGSKTGEFAAFFRLSYVKDILEEGVQYHIERTSGIVITGKVKYSTKNMQATAIEDLHVSEILISEDKTPDGGSLPNTPGTMYISKDADGVSERID